ncbi:MAG: tRNA (adenosine(37)-N6)-threonylcarbamoyltransferase complex dimerization subunit type 1 TsaB, partial [Burkholderiaceae bacterium]
HIYARRAAVGNAHSKYVLPMVRDVLADASVSLSRCDVIAYAAGPGSFTGLRVACAVAQGLAFGVDRPVVPVGTLAAIGLSVIESPTEPPAEILVVMDARMGEVYWTLLHSASGRLTVAMPPALATPTALRDRIAERIGGPIALGCGNAWAVHGDALDGLVERVIHRDTADAVDVAKLGRIAWMDGKAIAPENASPLYVRDDVALTTAERETKRQDLAAARISPAVLHGA